LALVLFEEINDIREGDLRAGPMSLLGTVVKVI
jgi:hypothetical protein